MTLVYEFLRRLEGVQEDIIAAVKSIRQENSERVATSLYFGDKRPFKREPRQSSMSVGFTEANAETAIDNITAHRIQKLQMWSAIALNRGDWACI